MMQPCNEKTGPNCGSCICKLEAGHVGQHENWHSTKWGEPEQVLPAGIELIAAERLRQVSQEGYDLEHDRIEHGGDELIMAAVAYLLPYYWSIDVGGRDMFWPWHMKYWKPTETSANQPSQNRIRELVKAGALIAAEIDRLQGATDATA